MPLECLRVKGGMGKKPERVSERRHEQSSRFGREASSVARSAAYALSSAGFAAFHALSASFTTALEFFGCGTSRARVSSSAGMFVSLW